jgi:PAS domain S-box-containing protein
MSFGLPPPRPQGTRELHDPTNTAPVEAEAQAWLAAIVDAADDAIVSKDLSGKILSWNRGAERLFGYTVDEIVGQSVTMLIPAERFDEEPAILRRIRAGERIEHYETVRRRKDGSLVDVSLTVSPVRNAAGHIVGASKIARQLTEKRVAEEAIRRLGAIVESSDDAILSKDLQGKIQSWNPSAERLFGYTAAEIIGQPISLLIPSDRKDEEAVILSRIRSGERVDHYETKRRRKDGTLIDISLTISPIKNAQNVVIGASKIARDISVRNETVEISRRLAAIVESSDDAIVSKNLQGVIQSWNAGAERLFGYTAAEAIGKPVLMLIPEGRQNEEPTILERLSRGERIDHYETVRRRKDGTLIDVSLTVSPITDVTGKVIGASKIARDITPQKRAFNEIKEAHEKALAANQAKDNFIAALSHELRTPLNPVLLIASDAAKDTTLPDRVRGDFEAIRKSVELEARLIDDLLDLARITNGKLALNSQVHDLHAILSDAVATVRADLLAKHLPLISEFATPALWVQGDAVRLQQVFWNVLKNAVKFTPEGGRISLLTRADASGNAVIEIADTGIGLTEEEIGRIFDSFTQGQHTQTGHRFGGLGLGLTITKLLTEMHGGTIRAASEGRGRGATFTILLPLAEQNTRELDPVESPEVSRAMLTPGSKRRILLVEDHDPTRNALVQLLGRRGFDVVAVATGEDARRAAGEQRFDSMICDLGLPDVEGWSLIAELASRHGLKTIAVTGLGMEEDIRRSREAGAVAHLVKPITIQALDLALKSALAAKA